LHLIVLHTVLLGLAAFLLGALPFSVIIGRIFLHKDITDYGDGNPGAANVFRAGGGKLGYLAVFLDILKGIPLVFISHVLFDLPMLSVVIVAVCAVTGHAFSPFLHWRGGKSIAITFGVLIALPEHEILIAFVILMVLCNVVIRPEAWSVMIAAVSALAFLFFSDAVAWERLLMLCLLAIFTVKHFRELRNAPGFGGFLFRWIQSLLRDTTTGA
jgi:glycerol-3-phosphate acyltransferase PlsY